MDDLGRGKRVKAWVGFCCEFKGIGHQGRMIFFTRGKETNGFRLIFFLAYPNITPVSMVLNLWFFSFFDAFVINDVSKLDRGGGKAEKNRPAFEVIGKIMMVSFQGQTPGGEIPFSNLGLTVVRNKVPIQVEDTELDNIQL